MPSRLPPNLIGDLPHQGQLLLLVFLAQRIAGLVCAEPTLWTDSNSFQRFLPGLVRPFGDEVGSFIDSSLHLFFILELRPFRADDSDDDILVLRQALERLEPTGPLCVIFKVECVHVEILEKLLGNNVVAALGEVPLFSQLIGV